MATPSNNRNRKARPTGGKGGGRAGKPDKPVAGTKDRTVRVPKEWNAKVVDPTNNRGGDQRATGGRAGGRAGKPSGDIARPAAKPTAKSNSKTNAPPSNNRPGSRPTMPNSSRAGINLPRAAVNALPKPQGPTTKGMTPTTVATGAAKATVRGVASRALMAPAIASQIANIKGGFEKLANHPFITKMGKGETAPSAGSRTNPKTAKTASARKPSRPASDYEKLFDPGGGRGNYGLDKKADTDRKREPVAPLPTSVAPRSGGSGSSRSTSRSTAPARSSTPTAPAKPGQKFADFNPGRGTSKTNNPLMKDMIKRMKDREDKEQASKAQQLTDKSRQNSGYTSAEKVDGSKYADELKKKKGYNFSVQ